MRNIIKAFSLCVAAITAVPAAAQQFPSGPVQLIIPFPPGGGSDLYARILSDGLGKRWGVPVVTENIAGAGGLMGMTRLARAKGDGQTLALTSSTFVTNAVASSRLQFEPKADVELVSRITDGHLLLVARTDLGAQNAAEFVELAKKQELFSASPGATSTATFSMSLLAGAIGTSFTSVNYAGGSEAVLDIIGKRVDLYLGSLTTLLPIVKAGDAVPLMVLNESRSSLLPEVPTVAEVGYPQAVNSLWYGVYAPSALDDTLAARINADIVAVMHDPAVVELLAGQSVVSNDADFPTSNAFLKEELTRMQEIAEKYKIGG